MPVGKLTMTTEELRGPYVITRDEIIEAFFEFAADNSEWVSDSFGFDENMKDGAVVCIAEIAGVARFIKNLDRKYKGEALEWSVEEDGDGAV